MMHFCKACSKRKHCIYKPTSDVADCGYFVRSKQEQKQTNADRIRAMSDEELAKFIDKLSPCSCCRFDKNECKKSVHCCDGIAEWLKSEVKE
jgi:hypothetical protein